MKCKINSHSHPVRDYRNTPLPVYVKEIIVTCFGDKVDHINRKMITEKFYDFSVRSHEEPFYNGTTYITINTKVKTRLYFPQRRK